METFFSTFILRSFVHVASVFLKVHCWSQEFLPVPSWYTSVDVLSTPPVIITACLLLLQFKWEARQQCPPLKMTYCVCVYVCECTAGHRVCLVCIKLMFLKTHRLFISDSTIISHWYGWTCSPCSEERVSVCVSLFSHHTLTCSV